MENKKADVEMVPSERGFAYCICAGFTLIVICAMGVGNTMGLIFNDFILEHGGSPSALSSIHGLTGIVIALAGLIVPHAQKRYSLRQLSLFAAACLTLCWIFSTFITKIWHMYFTYSIFYGIGWGVFLLTSNMTFNSYFVKKRVMFMSICMSLVGVACIFFPYLVEFFLREYGYRGTAALIAALTLHSVVGSALFQPVAWHLIPKQPDDSENKEINYNEGQLKLELKDQVSPLVKGELHNVSDIEKNNIEFGKNKTSFENKLAEDYKELEKLQSLIETDEKITTWEKLSKWIDLTLYKKFSFINVNLAMTFGIFTDLQFYILHPLLLFEYGFSKIEVATCISITSMADLVSKIFLIFIGRFFRVKSVHICYFSLIGTVVGRFVFLQYKDFVRVAVLTAFLGFCRGWFYVTKPLMCAEILPMERYASAFGLTMVVTGIINGTMSPVVGLIRELTGSFRMSFYFLAILCAIPIIPWTIELFILKKKKRKPNQ